MDYAEVRGFNYQPSYGSSGLELWQKFDAATIDRELGLGKRHFPAISAIRLWLSWDAFIRAPSRFARNFEQALTVAAAHGLAVMPCLFNRWHDPELDYGGIYVDHFLPRTSWVQSDGMFGPYIGAVVGAHADDERVFAWDLCNEPFSYSCPLEEVPEIVQAEFTWLEGLYEACKEHGAEAPITVGIHQQHGHKGIEQIEPISDVLSVHPYWTADSPPHEKAEFERTLDDYAEFADQAGKPILATECCWGALDDAKRVEIIRYSLGELRTRGIGWLAYLLHHSLIADAHRPEYGPVGAPGNLSLIAADDSLRPGHDVFNEF
jgi:hypothetical protein